ncbi:hypothetical protein [Leptothoe spongobia]|uniref:Uncharacterized protein n=1 Tax=Leptothoe spongobia TAU-MAC 1115 TaxID=1967444 RepID=A0A947DKD5_9CYAN|nr:hypothetical protein [Leptothoe spongobia]MBT9317974.1 hypothetical protein [Leptothoe spongobia TAU-MAC 1115]
MNGESTIKLWGLSITDLTALLMIGLTFVTTVANILLWISTRQTVKLLIGQIRHQVATDYSEAQHTLVDVHRELFLGILNNQKLLESFTNANGLDRNDWELEKISAFLVNQVLLGYLHLRNGIISPSHFEGFKRDAQDVFAYKTVCSHWQKVRVANSEEFRRFVDTELLWQDPGTP